MRSSSTVAFYVFLAIIPLAPAVMRKEENSLIGPYEAGGENLMHWDLTGSAQLGGSYIRLTTDDLERQGSIWNHFPCYANNWELQVQFHIHGKGVHLYGDGMAIWYVKDILHSGPIFGSKDYFSGLGVFIDTFENTEEPHHHRHPYVSALVNNGSLSYDHDEEGTMYQIGGCHVPVRNIAVPTRIAVSYIGDNLAVYVDFEGIGQWKLCFKAFGVYLPTGYHFGISAETSDVSDNHDVLSVTALSFDQADKAWEDRNDVIPHAENVLLPKYHKEHEDETILDEEDLQKVEHNREDTRKVEYKHNREDTQKVEHKREDDGKAEHNREDNQKVEHKREIKDDDKKEQVHRPVSHDKTGEASPPASLLRKLIYLTGSIIIILVIISTYRKYSERRRERMQKRLF